MTVCCCSLAGTAACQHCRNNPMATDVWTNKTVTVDHAEAKPFGNGIDICPVCGKPSTIGKPITNADRIRAMTDESIAKFISKESTCPYYQSICPPPFHGAGACEQGKVCEMCWLDWLKSPAEADNE